MARSDHCRCVSTPRCSRTSWKVVSIRQRHTKRWRIAVGSRSRSVQRNACASRWPDGSRTSTQRIAAGGMPLWYQTAVPETYSSLRVWPPYHSVSMTDVHTVFGSARTALSFGRRLPFSAGRPIWPFRRLGAGSNKLASRRNLVIKQTYRRTAAMSSNAEKPLSATTTTRRSGSQRLVCSIACFAQSVRALCRPPLRLAPARRRRQHSQEWQSPPPACERDRQHHCQRQPTQTAGLDKMAMRRAHRVAIDAAGPDFAAPAPLDGIVDADHHLAAGRQHRQEMEQQSTRHVAGVPACPVECFVVAAEAGSVRQPHDAQRLGDGALAGCEDSTADQHQDMVPDWGGEARSENRQPG